MKSFEIKDDEELRKAIDLMNYKLEKFWNYLMIPTNLFKSSMNYKLEKFWNWKTKLQNEGYKEWTINLKSFEINRDEE